MTDSVLPCVYYPSSIAIIDDNQRFIDEVLFNLDLGNNRSKTFTQPELAVEWLKEHAGGIDIDSCFTTDTDADSHDPAKSRRTLDLSLFRHCIDNKISECPPSVIAVDYDMPGMTGLELCKAIQNTPVKKILITGQADYELAVQAFNQGLIDRFILKGSEDFFEKLQGSIQSLTHNYFTALSQPLIQQIKGSSCAYPYEEELQTAINTQLQQCHAIAFCLLDTAGSLFIINGQQQYFVLLIKQQADLEHYLHALQELGKPAQKLHDNIQAGNLLPYFGEEDQFWLADVEEWQQHCYLAQAIQGSHTYYLSLISL